MTIRKLLADNKGTAAIEFVFAMPVLVTLMIGILQFSLVLQASGAMRNGIGEGLRYAKVNGISDLDDAVAVKTLKAKVKEVSMDAMAGIDRHKITAFEFTPAIENGARTGKIDISYEMDPLIPFADIPPIKLNESRMVYLPS